MEFQQQYRPKDRHKEDSIKNKKQAKEQNKNTANSRKKKQVYHSVKYKSSDILHRHHNCQMFN